MTKEKRAFRSFLFGIFGFAMAAAVLGALLFLWPTLISGPASVDSGSSGSNQAAQAGQIAAMQVVIDHLRYLLGGLALGLTGLVVIQTAFQVRHDRVQHQGVEQVSSVMGVVRETLIARLDSEQQERERADTLQTTIAAIKAELDLASRRRRVQDEIIAREREEIEAKANQLAAHTSRHQFRDRIPELNDLARQFDTFKSQSEPMEEPAREFSARVHYIRGIAAHYANDPERAVQYLTAVTERPVGTEPSITINRRLANAFYYLGVTHSNFGNLAAAIDSFATAIAKVPEGGDYLTRVVYAEALAMGGLDQAMEAVEAAKQTVADISRQFAQRAVPPAEHRLRSRATLIQANVAILSGDRTTIGDHVDALIRPLLTDDPDYYYATMTLAQAYALAGHSDSTLLFRQAYDAILGSNHLFTITEVRSKILLHMAAALCLRHGLNDQRHSEEHLDTASGLLLRLPKMNGVPCTVFSTLTKRNEASGTIVQHIRDIHDGIELIPGHVAMSTS
jgi:tetratricopeptide (TPR) repeat protein